MIIDMQQQTVTDNVLTMIDPPFAAEPNTPEEIKQTVILGAKVSVSPAVGGVADRPE